jgi:hypothetical protein
MGTYLPQANNKPACAAPMQRTRSAI